MKKLNITKVILTAIFLGSGYFHGAASDLDDVYCL